MGTNAADLQDSLTEDSLKVKIVPGLKESRVKFMGTGSY